MTEGLHHHGDGKWHDHVTFPGESWLADPATRMSDAELHQVTASGSGGVPVVPVHVLAQRPPNERAAYLRERRGRARSASQAACDHIDAVEQQLTDMDLRVLEPLGAWTAAVVEDWRRRHADELALLPDAQAAALTARAAVAFVFAFGLMSPVMAERGEVPADWELCVPRHMWPRIGSAARALEDIHPG